MSDQTQPHSPWTLCRNCIYWLKTSPNLEPDAGECHRFPPIAAPIPVTEASPVPVFYWPDTAGHEFCGEGKHIKTRTEYIPVV